jgi:hypothetical protein
MVFVLGQAGVSSNLQIPDGLTAEDLEAAEEMVLDWKEEGDYRAIDLVVMVYKYLAGASLGGRSGPRSTPEVQYSDDPQSDKAL